MKTLKMNYTKQDIEFLQSIKDAGFKISNRKDMESRNSTFVSLSFKIAYEIEDTLKSDYILEDKFIDDAAVVIGCSLLDPQNLYLYKIREWNEKTGEPVYSAVKDYLLQIHSYICNRQQLLTENEELFFGHNIRELRNLCIGN